jgi:hypothetical protein
MIPASPTAAIYLWDMRDVIHRGAPDQAAALMRPYAGVEIGAAVGNVNNNRPELIERVCLLQPSGWTARRWVNEEKTCVSTACPASLRVAAAFCANLCARG